MRDLVGHIRKRLSEKKFCTVFQNHLENDFPMKEANEEVKRALEKFAAENGWSVKITDSGIRATFRQQVPAQGGTLGGGISEG